MKEQIIQIPDTLKVKEIKDGMIILVEKEKKLTYNDIINNLFTLGGDLYYIDMYGSPIHGTFRGYTTFDGNIFKSKKQVEKLIAINMLMNVAKYLNKNWKPNWNNEQECKYYITIHDNTIEVESISVLRCIEVYFKSKELAKQAIEILGEETVKLALCTDY